MTKYKTTTSKETTYEAEKLAKANQRPGQTKEQTKLIAQGIQKGIEQYKKQQKSKARELDKRLKSFKKTTQNEIQTTNTSSLGEEKIKITRSFQSLPWVLLILSWLLFIGYIIL